MNTVVSERHPKFKGKKKARSLHEVDTQNLKFLSRGLFSFSLGAMFMPLSMMGFAVLFQNPALEEK